MSLRTARPQLASRSRGKAGRRSPKLPSRLRNVEGTDLFHFKRLELSSINTETKPRGCPLATFTVT
jgi:hypothetical protein